MSSQSTFRPKANLIWGGTALILDALFLAQVLFYPSRQENYFLDFFVATAVAIGAILGWIRPKIIFNDDHLIVVNPIRKIHIDYSAITGLETKWTLAIQQGQITTRVWVAPLNGKQRWVTDTTNRWNFSKMPRSDRFTGEATPASMSLNSDSGLAAELIRQRLTAIH